MVFEESIEVELDLSIWWVKSGYLFELQLDKMNSFYFNFYPTNADSNRISVNFNNISLAEFHIASSDLGRFNNHKIKFTYTRDGTVILEIDQQKIHVRVPAHNHTELMFKVDPTRRAWVPVTSLHHLSFIIDQEEKTDIAFSQVDGSDVTSIFMLQNTNSFNAGGSVVAGFSGGNNFIPVYCDTRIIVISELMLLSMTNYLNRSPTFITVNYNSSIMRKDIHYNKKTKTVYSFYPGLNPLAPVSDGQDEGDSTQIDTHHFEAGYTVNPVNQDLVLIGGYGHYTYHNDIFTYSFDDNKWYPFKTYPDKPFYPRTPRAVIPMDSVSVLIFGGHGNPTGKQGLPEFNYTDLWKLNLRNGKLTQLTESTIDPENSQQVEGVYRKVDNSLYLFVTKTKNPVLTKPLPYTVEIWKTSLDNPHSPELVRSFKSAPLFSKSLRYDKTNDAILYLVRPRDRNDNYKTFVLPFPILNDEKKSYFGYYGLLSTGLFLVFVISLSFVYRRQKRLGIPPDIIFMRGKSVKIFIHDEAIEFENGHSTQPGRLISFILDSPGYCVTHEQIKERFWKYVTNSSFKNSLSVTLSTLRKNISPFGNVVQNRDGKVFLVGNFKVLKSKR